VVKRWLKAMGVLAVMLAAAGMALAVTSDGSAELRAALGRGLTAASLVGLIVFAALQPRALRETETAGDGYAVSVNERIGCTFADVAANEEARRSLEQLRDYLVSPEKYARFGARMPRGVLLYGPPGTGKTLLARALAGEANVPFFALSGSDFVEKYVGVGAMRVRDLFRRAKKAGRCVIFIDEIDAMGKQRHDASSDERDQTLNALLSEMSGFRSGDGVIVLAATNRREMLDPALLRPGRFDRQIEVGLPGRCERLSILELHSRNKPLASDVSLEKLAEETVYFSGASLENLLNEAAIQAAAQDRSVISMKELRAVLIKSIIGADRESIATEEERRIIALHEAGHALMSRLLTPENRLARVSILPAACGAAGYNLTIPEERTLVNRRDMENRICVLLAGRGAELLTGGEGALTAGASDDLTRATELAVTMVSELGMAGEHAVSLKVLTQRCGGGSDASERARRILAEQFDRTMRLLGRNAEALNRLAVGLLAEDTLDGEEAEELLGELSNDC